jgi:anti-sigma B factor antagonist
MDIQVFDHDKYLVAKLAGVLDEDAHEAFAEHLYPVVEEGKWHILVDLADVPRVTSAGVGHLVTLVARVNTKQGRVVLTNLTPFVSTVFSATRLIKFFDIEEEAEAARARLLAD